MKFNLMITLLLVLVSACSSVDTIKKKSVCVVWKDQKYMGPYSTEVVAKKVSWKGSCQGAHWKCQDVEISYDDNLNVFAKSENIGQIANNEFQYVAKDATHPVITYTSIRVYPEVKEVRASVLENTVSTETVYHYNDKCSFEDTIVGGIALGLISKIQGKE